MLSNIIQQTTVAGVRMALFPGRADWQVAADAAGIETERSADMHGGELETSLMLHAAPELVGEGYADEDVDAASRPHMLMLGLGGYSQEPASSGARRSLRRKRPADAHDNWWSQPAVICITSSPADLVPAFA